MDYVLAKTYKDLEKQLTATKQSLASLQTKNVQLTTQLEDATDPTKIDNIIQERVDSFKQASPFLIGVDFDPSLTAIDWKKQALLKGGTEQVTLDSFSEEQIMAAFTTLTTIKPKPQDTSNQISDQIAKYRQSQATGVKTQTTGFLPQNRQIPSII